MNVKFLKPLFILFFVAGLTMSANAQKANKSATSVGVTARLGDQLTVRKVTDVDFGGILIPVDGTATTAVMARNGMVTAPGTTLYGDELRHAGQIRIDTNLSTKFDIIYPKSINLVKDGGSQPLIYSPMLYTETGIEIKFEGEDNISVTAAEMANGYFVDVAGSLAIPGLAASGTYTGVLDVTVLWE